jgi:hypothetical protein
MIFSLVGSCKIAPRSAMKDIDIYYPHLKIRDSRVVKAAMLIWDELEIIVPYSGFPLTSSSEEVINVIQETEFLRSRPPEL